MGLDLIKFQAEKGGNPDEIRYVINENREPKFAHRAPNRTTNSESQRRRFAPVEHVDQVLAALERLRSAKFAVQQKQTEAKQLAQATGAAMQAAKQAREGSEEREAAEREAARLKEAARELGASVKVDEESVKAVEAEVERLVDQIGNLVHESVVVSDDEANNQVVRQVGTLASAEGKLGHHEVLHRLHIAELERGVGVAGHRAYFLRGFGVRLNQALINYALDFLRRRDYVELQTPFFMRKETMAKTMQLATDHDLYHLTNDDSYLIATSEQPISALHQNEWFADKDIKGKPIKYAGYSTCFRREAGASGKDVQGIFRVHQFEKVEQFVICHPDESWAIHEQMVQTCADFFESLGLAFRVVNIVSKELNAAAAKKYDVEAWFPARQDFRELVSASNCTDYQSRALNVSCGTRTKEDKSVKYVHMLNGTMCATERTMCCLLENFQDATGFVIPAVLRPYLGGLERVDYVREAPPKEKTKEQRKQENPDAAKNGAAKK
jgi:seryl-tRNA synthetase